MLQNEYLIAKISVNRIPEYEDTKYDEDNTVIASTGRERSSERCKNPNHFKGPDRDISWCHQLALLDGGLFDKSSRLLWNVDYWAKFVKIFLPRWSKNYFVFSYPL